MAGKKNGPLCPSGKQCPSRDCSHFNPGFEQVRCDRRLRGEECEQDIVAAAIGRSVRTVERDEKRAIAKLRAHPELLATYPELAAKLVTNKSSTEPAPILGRGVGSRAENPQADEMKIPPNLVCEINALLAACDVTEDDVKRLQTIAATGDVMRFNAERDRIRATTVDGSNLDAYDIHRRNPELEHMMRGVGLTAADIRKHGPRAFNVRPNLDELVADSKIRGDRMGTGS